LPQLQTTFIKSLHDPTRTVRMCAASALGKLMGLTPRVDPLINELLAGVGNTEGGVQEGMIRALHSVLTKAGSSVDPSVLTKLSTSLVDMLENNEESTRKLVAKTLGAWTQVAPVELLGSVLSLVLADGATWHGRHGRAQALFRMIKHRADLLTENTKAVSARVQKDLRDDKVPVRQSAVECLGQLLLAAPTFVAELMPLMPQLISDPASDVTIEALKVVKRYAKQNPDIMRASYLSVVVPPVMNRLKDRMNLPLKLASERTLLHTLQVIKNPEVLNEYIQTLDSSTARTLQDYCKRIIAKLPEHSESEGELEESETQ